MRDGGEADCRLCCVDVVFSTDNKGIWEQAGGSDRSDEDPVDGLRADDHHTRQRVSAPTLANKEPHGTESCCEIQSR